MGRTTINLLTCDSGTRVFQVPYVKYLLRTYLTTYTSNSFFIFSLKSLNNANYEFLSNSADNKISKWMLNFDNQNFLLNEYLRGQKTIFFSSLSPQNHLRPEMTLLYEYIFQEMKLPQSFISTSDSFFHLE